MADPNSFIYVLAQIKPAEGKAEEILEIMATVAKAVEEDEPGCLSYQFFFSKEEYEIEVFEVYKDAAAAQAHKESAHFAETLKGMSGKLASPPKVQFVERKGGFRRDLFAAFGPVGGEPSKPAQKPVAGFSSSFFDDLDRQPSASVTAASKSSSQSGAFRDDPEAQQNEDDWGDFEGVTKQPTSKNVPIAAQFSKWLDDDDHDDEPQKSSKPSQTQPVFTTFTKPSDLGSATTTKAVIQPAYQEKPKATPARDPRVLFDAEEDEPDDDEFGDFEEPVEESRAALQEPDLIGLGFGPSGLAQTSFVPPIASKQQTSSLLDLDSLSFETPASPKESSKTAQPHYDLSSLGPKVSQLRSAPKNAASPINAKSSTDIPRKPTSVQPPKPRPIETTQFEEPWDDFAAWDEEKAAGPREAAVTKPRIPPPLLSPTPEPGSSELRPTNIPPPASILSLFSPLFTSADSEFFRPISSEPQNVKSRVYSDPATVVYFKGLLALATVCARVIAGRKNRWKRDRILAQSMRIGPAAAGGNSGLKLTSVDKGEAAKEDREAADVLRAWQSIVGRLKAAVVEIKKVTDQDLGAVPELRDVMPMRTAKQVEGGVPGKACALCGLKREERVDRVDVDVMDAFGDNRLDNSTSQPDSEPSYAPRHDTHITKNYSTSNLLSHAASPALNLHASPKNRYSLDASTAVDFDKMSKSPIIPEHAGEHGLGLSGLRRIRQTPAQINRGSSPHVGYQTAPASRSGSIHLTVPLPPSAASVTPSGPSSPVLNSIEDLNRFPSESLHSFSFAHQSEDSIDRRQNVLKRSIDFMRDKLGWAASNPGLLAAQARLSGDKEVQSMMELLSRAHVIGEDAEHAHGLGLGGPVTGPADLSGDNVFDKSFHLPRAESPTSFVESSESLSSASKSDGVGNENELLKRPGLLSAEASITLETLNKVTTDASIDRVVPSRPRTALKRTMTNTDDLSLSNKLTDTLAEPYQVHDAQADSMLTPRTLPSIPASQPIVPAAAVSHMPSNNHNGAPHGHGNRWAPAAQAIFTTEATTPWTITSANDLACLVFGVTRSEVRKLGILEVVQPERRKWLEEKLKDPDGGSAKGKNLYSQSQRTSPSSTTALNVGSGITARLLSKPPSRQSAAAKRRSQTDDGSGSAYTQRSKVKGGLNHTAHKSRGVLLCGDVVPIQKRNGASGSASLWVKEKKGGLIWVLEEIAEDVAYISVDEIGCVTKAAGDIESIWGTDRISKGMDITRLIPDIPKQTGTYTGALDYEAIAATKTYTARTSQKINIPVAISQQLAEETIFRISSFPHIAGIMVLSSQTLKISGSNSVFSAALFGQDHPDGLHINEIIPGFNKVLNLMTDEDKIRLVDGIVIPEHSFRRARAILAMREGRADAAQVFLRPTGLSAKHRDGAEIMVDVQMRVVKSEKSTIEEDVIEEVPDEHDENIDSRSPHPNTEVVYALWITYSRQLHAANYGIGSISPLISRPGTPPHQPSPGQTMDLPQPDYSEDSTPQPVSLLTNQMKDEFTPMPLNGTNSPKFSRRTSPDNHSKTRLRKKAISDFVVLEEMGQGAYGQVKLCRYKHNKNKKVVIKYVTKRRILVDTWTRDRRLGTVPLEIHVLDYLRRDDLIHPNIVEMSDFFEDDVNYYIEMVPHGLPGMDLFDYIELRVNMDEEECRKIFVQVAQAIWHLHIKAKVVHRDIKDENVILDGEGNIKLIDFGSAAYIKNGPFDVFVGTIDYAAPEVLAGQSYRGKEQDVWALGILLYTIIYKENPFYSIDEIMDHDLRVPYVMSDASIDLVRLMLNRDVDQRITIGEVLEHRWCQGESGEFEGSTPI
ncbi:hypothetical protein FKW77_006391 [Venturia effusa]|uniref:non-specific serine/threonine protein kinase n=1 Tax=Venturia effusa TaxID=50376 RepID=A0A517LDW9_9PEZI|nr:hypothetical protein FKW77_006391 [Venturia effusa]